MHWWSIFFQFLQRAEPHTSRKTALSIFIDANPMCELKEKTVTSLKNVSSLSWKPEETKVLIRFFRRRMRRLSVMSKRASNVKLLVIDQAPSLFFSRGKRRRVAKRQTLLKVAWSMSCLQRDSRTLHYDTPSSVTYELSTDRRKLHAYHFFKKIFYWHIRSITESHRMRFLKDIRGFVKEVIKVPMSKTLKL